MSDKSNGCDYIAICLLLYAICFFAFRVCARLCI